MAKTLKQIRDEVSQIKPESTLVKKLVDRLGKLVDTLKADLFRGTDKSLWNFWKHGATNSFLDSFGTCREQTRLSYVQGWSGRDVSFALEFGTCVHWVLEQAYLGKRLNDDAGKKAIPISLLSGAWTTMTIETYEEKWRQETPGATTAQLEQQETVYGLAESLLPAYFNRYDGEFTGKYTTPLQDPIPVKWVSLEEEFAVPYIFPDGKQTRLRGRRDGVFLDKKGKTWVMDTKCLSLINDNDIYDTLPVNDQMMMYLLVTWAENIIRANKWGEMHWASWTSREMLGFSDLCPTGAVMNVLRRPGQRWNRNKETLPEFLARVAEECNDPDQWDMKSDKVVGYFRRYAMEVAPDEVLAWKRDYLDPIMLDVRGWWEGTTPHYRRAKELVGKYGRASLFWPVVKGDFGNCYKRTKPFPELDLKA